MGHHRGGGCGRGSPSHGGDLFGNLGTKNQVLGAL